MNLISMLTDDNLDPAGCAVDDDRAPTRLRWEAVLPETPDGYGQARIVATWEKLSHVRFSLSARIYLDPIGGRDCTGYDGGRKAMNCARLDPALRILAGRLEPVLRDAWSAATGERMAA